MMMPASVEKKVARRMGIKTSGGVRSSLLSTIDHDGDGDQRQSAGVEHQKHDHGVGGTLFLRIQFLQSFHSFESKRGGSVVQSQHVGRKIHKRCCPPRGVLREFRGTDV